MNADRLLALYEQVAEAPDAIARLRRFVLDLAVRGKLVERDLADEPASELLKRIAVARESTPQSGRSGGKKRVDPSLTQLPFALPNGWSKAKLSALVRVVNGRAYKKPELLEQGTPVLRVGNLFTSDHWYYSNLKLDHDKYCDKGDLIYAWSASFGPFIWDGPRVIYHYHIWKLPLFSEVDLDKYFLYLFLLQKTREIKDAGHGISMVHMTKEKMEQLAVPLPPLAEQGRIVAKVEELMALLDRLEAARGEREAVRDRLTAAGLARLTAPDTTAEDFPAHARFALDALPALTTRPDQIKPLRQTILNLAVRGKLVAQELTDEPASELLKRKFELPDGYARRRKIIKEASVDASEGLLAPIPDTWTYACIQDLYDANIVIDYADGNHGSLYPRSSEFGEEGVIFVSAKDLVDGRVSWETCSKLNEERASQLTKGWAQTGDVLLTHNATVGRVAMVVEQVEPFLLGTSVTFYRLNGLALFPDFFFLVLQSPIWQGQLEAIMAQTTRNQVSIQKQAFFKIPLPPLSEQHRIVAKIDALMALCDRLETALAAADATRARLLESLLHEALTPAAEAVTEVAA